MNRPRSFVAAALLCAIAPPLPPVVRAQSTPAPGLRIAVLEGDAAVNIIQQKTAVAPLVEVRDRNNQPVAGALVTFTIQGGSNASFAGASTISATTNALGQAAAAGLTPTGAGAVQINVAAAFQGQTAAATIAQTNFATAAQAAAAGSCASSAGVAAGAGGGGGGIGAGTITTLGLIGAGAAGGLYAYKKHEMGEAPGMTEIYIEPPSGLAAITPITINAGMTWHGEGAMLITDWGDGTTTSKPATPPETATGSDPYFDGHVYAVAGTFTIRHTLTDAWDRSASLQAAVTITSLTGQWRVGSTASYFTIVQQGSTLSGTFTSPNADACGTLSGTAQRQSQNNVRFSVTASCPAHNVTFVGTTFYNTTDQFGGALTMGSTTTNVQLVRQ
jgi:hypothetical protein